MGPQWSDGVWQGHGLGGPHAGTGRGSLYQCHPWPYPLGSLGCYYRLLIEKSDEAVARFKRLALAVWDVRPEGKDDKAVALEGLETMESWMRELGLAMTITEVDAKEADIESMPTSVLAIPVATTL